MRLEQKITDMQADRELRERGKKMALVISAFVSGTDEERAKALWEKANDLDSFTQLELRRIARRLNPFLGLD